LLLVQLAIEKSRAIKEDLAIVFVDIEKAYDRVCRPKLWRALKEELGMTSKTIAQI
jgi:hypothetical protein